ncbi:MAG: cation-efflux pump [Candidatus Omnitrophica bacterium]|nr:cation-efflux pump [Candidatus Omnitrophota bacterium]
MKIDLEKFLIKKANLTDADLNDAEVRSRYGYLEGWISLSVNLLLFAAKMAMGVITASISIIADAVHTVSDVATSAIVIWGFKVAKKPADKEHPFGHGRMENIATLIIAVLLCAIGAELLRAAFTRISEPREVKGNIFVIIALIVSIIIKEWMARFSFSLAKKIKSSTLFADAWHHRSDAISTLLVIAAIIGSMYRIFKLDALFGAVVALYIIYTGVKLIKEATVNLLGKAADKKLQDKIRNIARSVEGVEGVHDVIVHDYGDFKAISLHVEVEPALDSVNAHKIATSVEAQIARQIKSSPIVHIDLKKGERKKYSKNFKHLEKMLKRFPRIINFHTVEILSNESGDFLTLHIVLSKIMSIEDSHALVHSVQELLSRYFKGYKINMHVEPCDSRCEICSQACKQY